MVRKSRTKRPTEIYDIKITLLDAQPPIWRRFAVSGNVTLGKLHDVIQVVMGWTNSHLHQFIIGEESYGMFIPDLGLEMDVIDESTVKLRDAVGKRKRFVYEYDFGDSWEHTLEVLKVGPAEPDVRYPVCLAGKRACPPEDCGGVGGYESLLQIIADPTHEEHEEMMEWLGDEFDPEAFHLGRINGMLSRSRI